MNIIAIMGPHGVFYKDEPIKELESALVAQGFQIIWPQNSVDLLKFIEHNPRICGVIFDWDEYSLDLCSDINQLNEYPFQNRGNVALRNKASVENRVPCGSLR
jgi:lysine decarboxylase